uniref:Uncharacterized protein n=1 Tax=Amphimedon queenslandica TaxID=400682 RepID=A0A1X7UXB1_AMPQE
MLSSVERNEVSIRFILCTSILYGAHKHKISQEIFMEDLKCPLAPLRMEVVLFLYHSMQIFDYVEKKAAQTMRQNTPLFEGRFLDQKSASCNQFRAGNALRSSKRCEALEETGGFGAMCRHDLPIKMLNLNNGERPGYADFILKDFEHISSSPVNLLYDVGCKLVLHWKANNHTSLLSNYNVSVFHSFAHIALCQAKYSPRNKEGFGLCDGENLERLWSYLRKFCKMTKEMSIANRVDAVLDKCYFWPTNKSRNNATHGTQHLIRLECTLSTIEGEHQIVSRWTPDCHEYMEVIAAKKISAREVEAKNKPIEL